jgi:pyruvate dehydrogenase E1 component
LTGGVEPAAVALRRPAALAQAGRALDPVFGGEPLARFPALGGLVVEQRPRRSPGRAARDVARTTSESRSRPLANSIRSPGWISRLGFARSPLTCTRPPLSASTASARVLTRRAAQSHLSMRTRSSIERNGRTRVPVTLRAVATPTASQPELDLGVLDEVQRRVLWLAASIVHHANRVRETPSGVKVGGHQASSASMVSLMTALWFGFLEAPDRVSVKPHASPVLHALNYLLGRLDRSYLTTLRQFGGLQSYPSRTKDPDPVDYSTGSVGLGATAPVWGAIAHRYVAGHFDVPPGGRQIALIGDAELDEGACWEAIADPMVARLGEVMWVVDLNRQSLDRVVPDIAAGRLQAMFEAAGWHCVMVKYGPLLAARPDLRRRIDLMPNEEYQRLLRAPRGELRERLEVDTGDLDDRALLATFRDLGGHDLGALIDGYRQAAAVRDRPERRVRLHDQGLDAADRGASRKPLGAAHRAAVRVARGPGRRRSRRPVGAVRGGQRRRGAVRRDGAQAHARGPAAARAPPALGAGSPRSRASGLESTQQAFGRFFVDLEREAPDVAERVVTVSPDVGTSTNLGGWINKAGIWSLGDRTDWFRRRHGHARALARVRSRAPHRARDRGGQPGRAAG